MEIKSLQSKLFSLELRLKHGIKKLSFPTKIILLVLLSTFFVSGIILLYKIDQKLSIEIPAEGGTFTEGIMGTPRFVNPVLTISDADRDLTSLIYSGLMRLDNGRLIPDLAEEYEISKDELCYTFTLKPNLKWSDGKPLTSNDIIFTIKQIQNPLTKSPKRGSWEGVNAEKIDDKTVKFCLQKPYAPFLENTTIGILPQHLWQEVLPEQMPLSTLNIKAVGSGPYKVESISRNSSGIITSYILVPNENFALQKPLIKKINLKFYPSLKKLLDAYRNGEVDNISAISPQDVLKIKKSNSTLKTYLLPRVFAVFFNQDNAPIFTDKTVRRALKLATDKEKIVNEVLKNFGTAINSPIPPGSLGAITFPNHYKNFDEQLAAAKNILAKDGWKADKDGILVKKTKKETKTLEFSLSTSNIPDLVKTAHLLKTMWEKLGAKVNLKIYESGDLEEKVIRSRDYNALLFGEVMGRDPDAFAFWHSSQRNDPGLNVALYANITVDNLLEKARATYDPQKRKEIYRQFQNEIHKDTPAIFLYSPYFIYLTNKDISGITQKAITIPSERFSRVYKWHIATKKVWKMFLGK